MNASKQPMYSLRRIWFGLVTLMLLGLFLPLQTQASHIVGGEITYECLGNNQYRVKLNVYRDCFYGDPTAFFDNPATVGIFTANGTLFSQLSMPYMGDDTLSNQLSDPCLFVPDDVCVHTTSYQKVVTLPFVAGGYELVYQRCCRNQTVVNIIDPVNTGATYNIKVTTQALMECNSAPDFGGLAPLFVCVNKPLEYDHSAIDADGDSLVYRLCDPLVGGSFAVPKPVPPAAPPYDSVMWVEPFYNKENMLGGDSMALTIDPQTGFLTAFPEIIGQFVVGVCVEEYRNGQLLSTVRRDFQYNVGECGEVISSFFAPVAQCDNLEVAFDNQSTFANEFIWYFDWPNTTPSSTQPNPVFTFPDTGTYTVVLIAQPSSICVDTFMQDIFLQDNSLFADYEFEIFDCETNSILTVQDLSYDTVTQPVSWFWEVAYGNQTQTSNEQNPTFVLPNPVSGTINLTVTSVTGCVQTLQDNFETGLNFPDDFIVDSLFICLGETINLNPDFALIGDHPYFWEPPGQVSDPFDPNPSVSPTTTTTYTATIYAPDSLCNVEVEVTVVVEPLPELDFDYYVNCDGLTVDFTNTSINADSYSWNFGDPASNGDVSTQTNPSYTYSNAGTYTVMLATGPGDLCQDTVLLQVVLEQQVLQADFTYAISDCETDQITISFFDQSINTLNNTDTYFWEFSNNGTSNLQNPTLILTNSQVVTVSLTITTEEGCVSSTSQQFPVQLIQENLVDEIQICIGETTELNPNGNPSYEYLWSPTDFLIGDPTDMNPSANPPVTTVYTVTISNIGFDTCSIVRQVTVFVPPAIGLEASDDVVSCEAETTLTATTDEPATLLWRDENNSPLTGGNNLTVPISGSTFYTVTATDQYGCKESDTVFVSGGPVQIAASGDWVGCTDEVIDVFVTNLDPNDLLSYDWNPNNIIQSGANTNDPTILPIPGIYTLTVDAVNQFGCTQSDTVEVVIIDSNIDLDFQSIVQCDGFTVEFVNLSTNAFSFVWDFGDPTTTDDTSTEVNPTYVYPGIGTYTVTLNILYDADCVVPVSHEVEVVEPELLALFDYSFETCSEDSVVIQFTDQSINFLGNTTNWQWTFMPGGTSNEQNPSITVYNDQILTVELTISNDIDCEASITETIEIDLIQVPLPDTILLCYGDTTELNPDGEESYSYQWIPNYNISAQNIPNPSVWPLETTTYLAAITSFTGDTCTVFKEITVIVPPQILLSVENDFVACNEPATLTVSANLPGLSYVWTNGNGDIVGTGAVITVFPTQTTTYCVTATDAFDCSVQECVTIIVPTGIQLNISDDVVSCNDPVTLTVAGNVPGLDYQWFDENDNPVGSGPQITVDPDVTTTYYVIAYDNFDCTATAEVTVIVPPIIELDLTDDEISCNLPIELNVISNVTPVSFVWFDALGNPIGSGPSIIVDPGLTTTYVVVATDTFNCTTADTALITVPETIVLNTPPDTIACTMPIALTVSSNVSPIQYIWCDSNGNPLGGVGATVTVEPDTIATYFIKAMDSFGCEVLDSVTVTNAVVDISTAGAIIICPVDSLQIDVTNEDLFDFDVLTYQWTVGPVGTILSDPTAAEIWIATDAGTQATFYVEATNQFGCVAVDSVEVLTSDFTVTMSDTLEICPGIPTGINPNGNPNYVYAWSPAIGLDDSTLMNPTTTIFEDITYTVTITDFGGLDTCFSVMEVVVEVNPDMELEAFGDTTLCAYTTTDISAFSQYAFDYQWFDDPAFNNNIGSGTPLSVDPVGDQTYYVIAEDNLGCLDTAQVTILAFPVDITTLPAVDLCLGESVGIEVVNNASDQELVTIEWTPAEGLDDPLSATPLADPTISTMYYVVVENQYGCMAMDSTYINVVDVETSLFATADPDTLIFGSGVFSQLETVDDSGYLYSWDPSGTLDFDNIFNPQALPEETTIYTVTIEGEAGCSAQASVTVVVINPDCEDPFVFVPSGFTPNGDDTNDILYVLGDNLDPDDFYFAIYDRWGQKIFETLDPANGWDGTFKGQELSADVFGYYLQAKCYNGEEYFEKGNITLIR